MIRDISLGMFWLKCEFHFWFHFRTGSYSVRLLNMPCYASDEETEEKGGEPHGHVNSISVLRSYRRLGLAKRLMILSRTSHLNLILFHLILTGNFYLTLNILNILNPQSLTTFI